MLGDVHTRCCGVSAAFQLAAKIDAYCFWADMSVAKMSLSQGGLLKDCCLLNWLCLFVFCYCF